MRPTRTWSHKINQLEPVKVPEVGLSAGFAVESLAEGYAEREPCVGGDAGCEGAHRGGRPGAAREVR